MTDSPVSEQIAAILSETGGWRAGKLEELRACILAADPGMAEEIKWKKPSRPLGVPVWTHGGNVCIGEPLKNAVRLTFPKGALLPDPAGLFNTRLDSTSVRAIDFSEGDRIDGAALKALVLAAAKLNLSGPSRP